MERDDIIEYAFDVQHDEEHGKKVRKKIWFVTIVLSIVTTVEVVTGIYKNDWGLSPLFVKWAFIILTIFKAGYIIMSFMHLGDERKNLRYVILAPYTLFILYLVFICLTEGVMINEQMAPFLGK